MESKLVMNSAKLLFRHVLETGSWYFPWLTAI